MTSSITTRNILDALIALADDKIWASELALAFDKLDRRVDFWTLEPVRSKGFRAQAYEIKVSRADFKRDSQDKQAGALRFADRFWYVTPPALLNIEEVPEWSGLMEWNGERFSVKRKAPPRQKEDPSWPFVVSLLRNSGDCRRDVGLMKAEIAFYRQSYEERRRIDSVNRHFSMRRWIDKAARKAGTA